MQVQVRSVALAATAGSGWSGGSSGCRRARRGTRRCAAMLLVLSRVCKASLRGWRRCRRLLYCTVQVYSTKAPRCRHSPHCVGSAAIAGDMSRGGCLPCARALFEEATKLYTAAGQVADNNVRLTRLQQASDKWEAALAASSTGGGRRQRRRHTAVRRGQVDSMPAHSFTRCL